jgi:hypothetical protein
VGAVKMIDVAASGGALSGDKKKGKKGMKLNLPPKLLEKLVWVLPVISFLFF